jgi:hypothetical protein
MATLLKFNRYVNSAPHQGMYEAVHSELGPDTFSPRAICLDK